MRTVKVRVERSETATRSVDPKGESAGRVIPHDPPLCYEVPHYSGSLAQLVEQLTFNQLVAGSNPARPTIISSIEISPQTQKPHTTQHRVGEILRSGSSRAKRDSNALALTRRASSQDESSRTTHHYDVIFHPVIPFPRNLIYTSHSRTPNRPL